MDEEGNCWVMLTEDEGKRKLREKLEKIEEKQNAT